VDPETPEEKDMFGKYKDKPVKWMDWLRTQANPDWWIAVAKVTADIANKTINLSNLESLYRKNLRLYELSPYIGRIGYGAYQDADITQTRTFSGKPVYYQELKTGKLIPLEISEDGVVKKSISLTEWLIEKSKWYSGSLAKLVKRNNEKVTTESVELIMEEAIKDFCAAQEGYYTRNRAYTDSVDMLLKKYNFKLHEGVQIALKHTSRQYVIQAQHINSDKMFTWKGPGGKLLKTQGYAFVIDYKESESQREIIDLLKSVLRDKGINDFIYQFLGGESHNFSAAFRIGGGEDYQTIFVQIPIPISGTEELSKIIKDSLNKNEIDNRVTELGAIEQLRIDNSKNLKKFYLFGVKKPITERLYDNIYNKIKEYIEEKDLGILQRWRIPVFIGGEESWEEYFIIESTKRKDFKLLETELKGRIPSLKLYSVNDIIDPSSIIIKSEVERDKQERGETIFKKASSEEIQDLEKVIRNHDKAVSEMDKKALLEDSTGNRINVINYVFLDYVKNRTHPDPNKEYCTIIKNYYVGPIEDVPLRWAPPKSEKARVYVDMVEKDKKTGTQDFIKKGYFDLAKVNNQWRIYKTSLSPIVYSSRDFAVDKEEYKQLIDTFNNFFVAVKKRDRETLLRMVSPSDTEIYGWIKKNFGKFMKRINVPKPHTPKRYITDVRYIDGRGYFVFADAIVSDNKHKRELMVDTCMVFEYMNGRFIIKGIGGLLGGNYKLKQKLK